MEYEDEYYLEEDKLGMTLTAGSVTLDKNESNLIGISIGGGGKYCPCLYVVQVFDNTASSREGTLQSGDEITGVNSTNVKGKSKTEVAQLIQRSQGTVTIFYNKLHHEPRQGKSLDIALKKVKHRLVEGMSSSTADAFGLSRAILCNDSLVKKLEELTRAEEMYRALIDHAKLVFKAFFDLIQVYKKFGDVFCGIGVREIQTSANEAFNQFGEAHRQMEKYGIQMLKKLKPILGDLGTYLHKAIPDTRLTIKRYADVKFEYLSYCLKVKEMDDEEIQFAQMQEPLYRVETGNYEYRLVLRCRQDARASFARLRSDVLVKLELLDSKHVQHLTQQLTRLVTVLATCHTQCEAVMHGRHWFPIELDLVGTALYGGRGDEYCADEEEDEEEDGEGEDDDNLLDGGEEATEESDNTTSAAGQDAFSNEQLLGQLVDNLILDDTLGTNNFNGNNINNNLSGTNAANFIMQPTTDGGGVSQHQFLGGGGVLNAQQTMTTVPPQNMVGGYHQQQQNVLGLQQNMTNNTANSTICPSMVGLQQQTLLPANIYTSTEQQQPPPPSRSSASVAASSTGMSRLSQEFMAEPSLEKQLEAFMTPERKRALEQQDDCSLLDTSSSVLVEPSPVLVEPSSVLVEPSSVFMGPSSVLLEPSSVSSGNNVVGQSVNDVSKDHRLQDVNLLD